MIRLTITFIIIALFGSSAPVVVADDGTAADSLYIYTKPSRDGIGKVYLGREISHVMGHRGAAWLERRTRAQEEQPDQAVVAMELKPDDVVADIGAGTGYFSFRMATLVPQGKIYAVDIQPEMLAIIEQRMASRSVDNIVPVKGSIIDPGLPENSIDAALFVDAYHEFSHPYEMMQGIVKALKPGGRVFLIEYRGEDPSIPIKRLHKMTQTQAKKEMNAVGLEWVQTKDFLPTQHFMVFRKPIAP